jgi:hypothetical protein
MCKEKIMRKRFLGLAILMALVSAFGSDTAAQRRPAQQQKPAASDLKIKYKQTTSGQSFESTTMIKGQRERGEMRMASMDMVNITQCDLKRTIQVSDTAQKYLITPMAVTTASSGGATSTPTTSTPQPTRRGGVVTYTITNTDTGERKEMFGFTARHIKTSMLVESSPDACNKMNQKMETDGWYIDFSFGLQCDVGQAQTAGRPSAQGGCQDRYEFKNVGTVKKGYPLIETMTMYGPDGRVITTTTKEVLELSREPLDAALFDIPTGYTEAASAQELYVAPSVSEMTSPSSSRQQSTISNANEAVGNTGKAPGSIRIGVAQIKNKTDRQISTEALRARLLGDLQSGNVEAVPLNAMTAIEADAECKIKQCDFILYTDVATLKASKIGGMFGRVTGVTAASKTEAKLDYKLVAVGETAPRLQASASAKEEGDDNSAGTALAQEARAVSAAVRKGRN